MQPILLKKPKPQRMGINTGLVFGDSGIKAVISHFKRLNRIIKKNVTKDKQNDN